MIPHILAFLGILSLATPTVRAGVSAEHLRCEYFLDPRGVGSLLPHLNSTPETKRRGLRQG